MDRYQKVEKAKSETPISENELRITAQGRMRNYITYAISLLKENDNNEIVLKATGRAINKTVMVAETVKRRIPGLHQNTSTTSIDVTDYWEPLEEGLLPIETTRHISVITITLSKKELDATSVGYQSPLPANEVHPVAEFDDRGDSNGIAHENGGWNGEHNFRGRVRGRGRNFRDRGRGFTGGNHGSRYADRNLNSGYKSGRNPDSGYKVDRDSNSGRNRDSGYNSGGNRDSGYNSGGNHGSRYSSRNLNSQYNGNWNPDSGYKVDRDHNYGRELDSGYNGGGNQDSGHNSGGNWDSWYNSGGNQDSGYNCDRSHNSGYGGARRNSGYRNGFGVISVRGRGRGRGRGGGLGRGRGHRGSMSNGSGQMVHHD